MICVLILTIWMFSSTKITLEERDKGIIQTKIT